MFIDIHVHVAAISDLPWSEGQEAPATPEQLVAMFDEVGIERAVMLPFVIPECNILTQSNEDILMIYEKYPDRFIPFCNIDPRLSNNSTDIDLSFVINHYKDKGCKGIGEMTANLPFDDPRVWNLFSHAEKCQMPLTFHVACRDGNIYGLIDDFGLPRFEKSVQQFPDLVWLAHSQSWWAFMSGDVGEDEWGGYPKGPVVEGGRVVELMRKYPNIYGDLSAGSGFNAVSRDPEFGYWFMNEFQDQLCFGTDVCTGSGANSVVRKTEDDAMAQLINFMKDALARDRISQEVFDKIASKNAERILKL